MSDNYILDYWNWLDGLSPDIRQIVVVCWDHTGRQISDPMVPVVQLLNLCDDFDSFLVKYLEMMNISDDDLHIATDDALNYYYLYMSGMKRLERMIAT